MDFAIILVEKKKIIPCEGLILSPGETTLVPCCTAASRGHWPTCVLITGLSRWKMGSVVPQPRPRPYLWFTEESSALARCWSLVIQSNCCEFPWTNDSFFQPLPGPWRTFKFSGGLGLDSGDSPPLEPASEDSWVKLTRCGSCGSVQWRVLRHNDGA